MASGTCGKNLTWQFDGDTLTIRGNGDMKNFSDSQPAPWSEYRNAIKKIIVGRGVTSIGDCAFRKCKILRKAELPDGITSIGARAFSGCALSNINIPVSVAAIGKFAFERCNLTAVKIPAGVRSIGQGVFKSCGLKNIELTGFTSAFGDNNPFGKNSETLSLTIHYPAGSGFEKILSDGNNAKLVAYEVQPVKPTTQAVKPSTAQAVKLSTAQAVKPSTTQAVKPSTAQAVKPPTTQAVKPPTTQAVKPSTAQPVKPSTAQPVKSTTQAVKPPTTQAAEKLIWKIDGRTLTVGGVRVIKNFSAVEPPWSSSLLDILNIVIADGVEEISAHAFEDCKRLEQVTFPASVKTVGDFAFTICYCGSRLVNGGRNVFWSLNDGILTLKKNPAAKVDADFSTGFVTWLPLERNITGVKLADGVKPTEKFLTWLMRRTVGKQISFG
ncbi:MAG: leucine-rich repeat protein [Quinella sp. 1Q7]|nr:leucine-rich repeat protein [Quinella sp. 1Q7]